MGWLALTGAIVIEVFATMAFRASEGLRKKAWAPAIVGGYVISFWLLSVALRHGIAVGVAYGIWSATGIALAALLARVFFREPLTRVMLAGIALIAVGVLLVELGAA
jgi:small multidrug resistance pump